MSGMALHTIVALHVIGVLVWIGVMMALTQILRAHGRAGPQAGEAFADLERGAARVMDIGATIAVVSAVSYLIATRGHGEAWALKQGWLHAKLPLVLVLLGSHGWLRARVGRAIRGDVEPLPRIFHLILGLLVAGSVFFAIVKPF